MIISQILLFSFTAPYYYNKDVHNFGNIGLPGAFHAGVSPLFTKFIDFKAYKSINIREKIYSELDGTVLDLCCGTGYSTCKNPGSVGIDTSKQMLYFANLYNSGPTYNFGNAETYGKEKSFDFVTCMFAFHEMPSYAHRLIIENAKRVARKKVIIVDISTNYIPSKIMLAGEPYILKYLKTIDETLRDFNKTVIVENHAEMWEFNLD